MSGTTIRTAAPHEGAAVRRVITEAFVDEGPGVAAIWDDLTASGLVRASLVAEQDGDVVGHVGLSHAWLDTRTGALDVWLLSPLSTLPDRQRQGVGTALLAETLRVAEQHGVSLVFLEGNPEFYGPRGFEGGREHGFRAPSVRIPVAAFQVAVLPAWTEPRPGTLVYPDVWWRHGAVGLTDPQLAVLEERFGSWDA